jgi:hypothetical protein
MYFLFTTEARRRGVKHTSKEPMPEDRNVEVDHKPDRFVYQLKVCEKLCFVDGRDPFNTLQLQNYDFFDEKVQFVAAIQFYALIHYWNRELPLEFQSAECQLMAKTLLIGRFH